MRKTIKIRKAGSRKTNKNILNSILKSTEKTAVGISHLGVESNKPIFGLVKSITKRSSKKRYNSKGGFWPFTKDEPKTPADAALDAAKKQIDDAKADVDKKTTDVTNAKAELDKKQKELDDLKIDIVNKEQAIEPAHLALDEAQRLLNEADEKYKLLLSTQPVPPQFQMQQQQPIQDQDQAKKSGLLGLNTGFGLGGKNKGKK